MRDASVEYHVPKTTRYGVERDWISYPLINLIERPYISNIIAEWLVGRHQVSELERMPERMDNHLIATTVHRVILGFWIYHETSG